MTITVKSDSHADSVIQAYEQDGAIVLIHTAGRYPTVTTADGRSTKDVPHVLIRICHNYADVEAVGPSLGWRRRALPINNHLSPKPGDTSREALIAHGKSFVAQAIAALPTIAGEFEKASSIYRDMASLPKPLGRADYEAACVARGIEPMADAETSTWGDFTFPQYALDKLPAILLQQKRAFAVEHEQEVAKRAATEAREAAEKTATEAATARPIVRTYRMILPHAVVGMTWMRDGAFHRVARIIEHVTITDDMPSYEGSHLLGYEGDRGVRIEINVR